MRTARRTLAAAAALLTTVALASCGVATGVSSTGAPSSRSVVEAVRGSKVLRVGVAPAPPYSQLNTGTQQWEGVVVDLSNAWATRMGVQPQYVGTTYGVIVAGLQAGRYDVVPALNDTPERRSAVTFSDPVVTAISVATVLPGRDQIDSWEKLNTADKTICTVSGSSDEATLTAARPAATILRLADLNACRLAFQSRRANAVFDEWHSQGSYASQTDGVRIVFPATPLGRQGVSAALSRTATPDDVAALNAAIDDFRTSGALADSLKKWGAVNPLQFAAGPVPDYATQLAGAEFRG